MVGFHHSNLIDGGASRQKDARSMGQARGGSVGYGDNINKMRDEVERLRELPGNFQEERREWS